MKVGFVHKFKILPRCAATVNLPDRANKPDYQHVDLRRELFSLPSRGGRIIRHFIGPVFLTHILSFLPCFMQDPKEESCAYHDASS